MFKLIKKKNQKGAVITLVLLFSVIFLILISSLLGFVLTQIKLSNQKLSFEQSLQIAEAGVEHYKWCLNNGIASSCSLSKDYTDPFGEVKGHFSIEVNSSLSCGQSISENIISIGWTNDFPNLKRKIGVLYARSSVAKYSYLVNENVWAGSDREIRGPYHSNGGVRMDGENTSVVSSSRDNWICTSSFGCGPKGFPSKGSGYGQCPEQCQWDDDKNCVCPGVFSTTDNANYDLFQYPVPVFDFEGITIDLAQIKNNAQANSLYLPPSNQINNKGKGYHLILKNDGTAEVRIITDLYKDWAYSLEEGWHNDYFRIKNEVFYNNLSIPSSCSVVFVEDNLWLEGVASGKVTIASASLINPNKKTNVILPGNIEYSNGESSNGLAVISDNNILISPDSPDNMKLYGIFIAQKGHFGRNLYYWNIKNKLEIYGAIVSNGRVGTQWTSGSNVISGYLERENYVDPNLIYNSPPFVPYTESNFKILRWREVE